MLYVEKNWFKTCLKDNILTEKLKKIKLIISDVDGALTDGYISIPSQEENNIIKNFSVQDGYGINQTVKRNLLLIAFVSGRQDNATNIRANMLEITQDLCFTGLKSKPESIKLIQEKYKILKEETLIYGDDILDYLAKDCCSMFVTPANALFYIKDSADLVLPTKSSENSFRLLLDLVLFVQKKHFAQELIEKSLNTKVKNV